MNNICVLGSMNMDLVVKVNELPQIGETILNPAPAKKRYTTINSTFERNSRNL